MLVLGIGLFSIIGSISQNVWATPIDKNQTVNLQSEKSMINEENSETQIHWMATDYENEGIEIDSGLILKVSKDRKTIVVPSGSISGPESIFMSLIENDISPEDVSKIIIEGPLELRGRISLLFAMLENLQHIEGIENIDVSNISIEDNGRMDAVFMGDSNLQELNLSTWNMTNYISDMSGMFGACWNLKKLIIGSNFKTSTSQGITDPPEDDVAFTGYWRAVGTGTERRPAGKRWNSVDLMETGEWINVVGEEWADTHVWEPVPAKITVKYVNDNGIEIHAPIENNDRNVSEDYDVTTSEYKIDISEYTLDASRMPKNAIGHVSDREPIVVTYVYKKM